MIHSFRPSVMGKDRKAGSGPSEGRALSSLVVCRCLSADVAGRASFALGHLTKNTESSFPRSAFDRDRERNERTVNASFSSLFQCHAGTTSIDLRSFSRTTDSHKTAAIRCFNAELKDEPNSSLLPLFLSHSAPRGISDVSSPNFGEQGRGILASERGWERETDRRLIYDGRRKGANLPGFASGENTLIHVHPFHTRKSCRVILIWQRRQSLQDELGVSGLIFVTIRRVASLPGAPAGRHTIHGHKKKKDLESIAHSNTERKVSCSMLARATMFWLCRP